MKDYSWPGNVRELENTITYAVGMSQNQWITMNELPEKTWEQLKENTANELLNMNEIEKIYIERALRYTDNNTELAAKILDFARSTLYRKMKEYNIDVSE